jgi:hypothetical protein
MVFKVFAVLSRLVKQRDGLLSHRPLPLIEWTTHKSRLQVGHFCLVAKGSGRIRVASQIVGLGSLVDSSVAVGAEEGRGHVCEE